jgi:DEAD/DEAH box helicase domain-containing protein
MMETEFSFEEYLNWWQSNPENQPNIVAFRSTEATSGHFRPLPGFLHPDLRKGLSEMGIERLYSHQTEALHALQHGENIVLSTGTASGKTLCYTIPIVDSLLKDSSSRALLVYPTKALTYDQQQALATLLQLSDRQENAATSNPLSSFASVYDGDTPGSIRPGIRERCRILSTNPDMLHLGILPHHNLWRNFISKLRFVVIDEIHLYRGVFGSHVANVFRRLQRICNFYGAFPQFVLTSATIANANELAEKLIERPCTWINQDGSPHGRKLFYLYNPPLVDAQLGIRKGTLSECIRIGSDFMHHDVQTILFARTRRMVELIVRKMQEENPQQKDRISSYRSGYLPKERRAIESQLRDGTLKTVAATNALELGIDIGGMDGIILVGYPGTIASTRQQSGRAGRRLGTSTAVLVTSPNPLDQYIALHPEYILESSPEKALINPDNLLILLEHVRCAVFELPFERPYRLGKVKEEDLEELLKALVQLGEVFRKGDRFYWIADKYPSARISLRSTGSDTVLLETLSPDGKSEIIGEVDQPSSYWMVHPGAIYLHQGRTYQVDQYKLDKPAVRLSPVECDYYTSAIQTTEVELEQLQKNETVTGGSKYLGELKVSSQVTGFKRVAWESGEILSNEELEMPVSELNTVGYWITLNEHTVQTLREQGQWSVDKNVYGKEWNNIRDMVRRRDNYTCQVCGKVEQGSSHHVHHKIPFRSFFDPRQANTPGNLVTLCANCHQRAEMSIYIRTGLMGLSYLLHHLTPIFTMCDINDIGSIADPQAKFADGLPTLIFYDEIPAGIGLCQNLYDIHYRLLEAARDVIASCKCMDGCPNCVGPTSMAGMGGKEEANVILQFLLEM